jgi:hypothetical protein
MKSIIIYNTMASSTTQPSDASRSQTPVDNSDNAHTMTLVVGREKDCQVASPSPTAVQEKDVQGATSFSTAFRPKRILPKNPVLAPGAEYTPWGDLMWELRGQEDGTLGPGSLKPILNPAYWEKRKFILPSAHDLILIMIERIPRNTSATPSSIPKMEMAAHSSRTNRRVGNAP